MIFANKDAFTALGTEPITPSLSHASQDCTICTQPLAVHPIDQSPKSQLRGYHDAIRITACGHTHGATCLSAWLDVGNSCPTCARILFEVSGDPITQRDIICIVRALGPLYGEARVNVAIVGLAQKQEVELKALRRVHEQEVARQKVKDGMGGDEEFLLGDGDWSDSDVDGEFEEDGDDEGEGDGDLDGDLDVEMMEDVD